MPSDANARRGVFPNDWQYSVDCPGQIITATVSGWFMDTNLLAHFRVICTDADGRVVGRLVGDPQAPARAEFSGPAPEVIFVRIAGAVRVHPADLAAAVMRMRRE